MKARWLGMLLLLVCLSAMAAETGRLEGTVRDSSNAVVPSTAISCVQDETGFRFAVLTNDHGEYALAIPEGNYKVLARRAGFRTIAQMKVFVAKGGTRKLDFQLEPGSISEVVTVSDVEGTPHLRGTRWGRRPEAR